MQLKKARLIVAVSSLLSASGAYGQIPTESVLTDNTAKLKVTVKMDRDVYFPGELYEATFEVTNPTSSPLLVITPFQGAECVSLSAKEGDKLINLAPQDGECRQVWNVPPVTTFGSGETRKEVLHSYGESFWPEADGRRRSPGRRWHVCPAVQLRPRGRGGVHRRPSESGGQDDGEDQRRDVH